jgi:hypothetical protein
MWFSSTVFALIVWGMSFSAISLSTATAQPTSTATLRTDNSMPLTANLDTGQELKAWGGHQFLASEELGSDVGPKGFAILVQERRWAVDVISNLQDGLAVLRARQQANPEPLPITPFSEQDYKAQVDEIDNKIRQDERAINDPQVIDTERSKDQADLLDQTRRKAQLDLRLAESRNYEQRVKDARQSKQQVDDQERGLLAVKHYLAVVDDAISRALVTSSSQNNFRTAMGAAFTVLVGLLIFVFYLLARRDSSLRRSILSGDIGLQFITLFSLVIAIILLGIMNILEGRELSALLGGLSGYILGRQGAKTDQPKQVDKEEATSSG